MESKRKVAEYARRKNAAEGSILGAFIGDSIGSAVEFQTVVTDE